MHLSKVRNTSLSRCLMAGFACGIVAALLNVLYSYFYRHATDFDGSLLFTPLLIFVGFPILFVLISVIFYEIVDHVKKGKMWFTVIFLLLTALAAILSLNQQSKGAEGLQIGIMLISGFLVSLLLPFLATHAKVFMDEEEFKETAEP
jgi:hypothetical protein